MVIMVKTINVFVITNSIFILQSLLNNIKKKLCNQTYSYQILIAIRYFSKPEIFQLYINKNRISLQKLSENFVRQYLSKVIKYLINLEYANVMLKHNIKIY